MGNSQSYDYKKPLRTVSTPVGVIDSQYIAQKTTTLHLRELVSWTGDDFKIKDLHGNVMFRCAGHFFSGISQKKTILDMHNKPVFNIKEKFFSFTTQFRLFRGGGSQEPVGEIFTELTFLSSKIHAIFTDLKGKKLEIFIRGNYRAKEACIFRGHPKSGGTLLARVYRPTTGRSVFLGRQDYYLEIAPGVDMALMVALCIMIDESYKD